MKVVYDKILGELREGAIPLETANDIVVNVTSDAKTNGANLIAAYAKAKALTPNGSALSATNRACVIVPPAKYDLDYGDAPAPTGITITPDDVGSNPVTWYYRLAYSFEDDDGALRSLLSGEYNYIVGDNTTEIIVDGGTIPTWAIAMIICLGTTSGIYTHFGVVLSFPSDIYGTILEYSEYYDLLIASGIYQECVPLILDTEFVDIIGLTTDRSLQHIYGTPEATNSGVIIQTANDVHISNLTVEILTEVESANRDDTDSAAYFPSTNLSSTVITNCEFVGGSGDTDIDFILWATRMCIIYSGTFNYCTGGYGSFGYANAASGTFNYCTGGEYSFGGNEGTASGTFNHCTGGDGSFGYAGAASGTFTNCTGGDYSFGGYGIASGTFINCTGGEDAFGGEGIASGTFLFCKGGVDSFADATPTASVATIEIVASGTGYQVDDELTVIGGTGTAATIKVIQTTNMNGGLILLAEILTIGSYTVEPANAVAVTGGTGNNDATFSLAWNEGHIYGCVDDTGFIAELNWDD